MDEVYVSVHARHARDDRSDGCGDRVTVVVRRSRQGRIELLHHGVLRCGAELTEEQARELVEGLQRTVGEGSLRKPPGALPEL